MAPDDNAPNPKAPDKIEKNKCDKANLQDNARDKDKDEKTLSNLNDGELKALLDEAITYKNPKDREGKSKLFKDLLIQAEESERIARAASAGGSELVRHCNPSARRRQRGYGGRHQRAAEAAAARERRSSAAEHPMHGGSLDNLAKEELYARCSAHNLTGRGGAGPGTSRRSVSARQREGGSLPCDVNSSLMPARDYQFLEEARKMKDSDSNNKEFTTNIDTLESQRLLDHDELQQTYQETQEVTIVPRYTSQKTLQISATPVDEAISLDLDNVREKKSYDCEAVPFKTTHNKYMQLQHEKKFDENGNAVQQNQKIKKKKSQTDKNVVSVLNAELVEGHRSDIINDVDKLTEFISGEKDKEGGKSKALHKSKHLHKQHTTEDGSRGKKQRTQSSKSKETARSELKKSNSLGEISTSTLEDFAFSSVTDAHDNKVVLRLTKERIDRPKERRSWGNVEPPSFDILSSNASTENLEQAENWVVTKPKKKSKKRRNSVSSSSGRRQTSSSDAAESRGPTNRAPSPELRGGVKSVPYSEKSNDSSDADSVHSLPIDSLNTAPISYADIAKNSEKSKEKKPDKPERSSQIPKEKSPCYKAEMDNKSPVIFPNMKISPPDVTNPKNFPAIPSETKNLPVDVSNPKEFPIIQAEPKSQPPVIYNSKSVMSEPSFVTSDFTCRKNFPATFCDVPKNGPVEVPLPPIDVTSPKSFPSLPIDQPTKHREYGNQRSIPEVQNVHYSRSCFMSNNNADRTNIKSSSVGSDTLARNVSSGDNINKSAVNNNVRSAELGYTRVVNANVGVYVLPNNIQNDLSMIHLKEKESIQYNAQMLPPNIPDVQTIEKMHFMNRLSPSTIPLPPVNAATTVTRQSLGVDSELPVLIVNENVPPPTRPGSDSAHRSDCDSSERTISGDFDMGPVDNEDGIGWEDELPPVIILSGAGANKEVPGLVFGFDINEQLLNEDICEGFIARFVTPEAYTQHSHNHDKIVNFIESAWEAIVNQMNGEVQYYTDDS